MGALLSLHSDFKDLRRQHRFSSRELRLLPVGRCSGLPQPSVMPHAVHDAVRENSRLNILIVLLNSYEISLPNPKPDSVQVLSGEKGCGRKALIYLQGTSPYNGPHVQHGFAPEVMLLKNMPIPTFVSVIPLQMCITYRCLSKGDVILN